MFNLLPGQGLGFTGSKLIAFGLAPLTVHTPPLVFLGGGGGSIKSPLRVIDNAYSSKGDDEEVIELCSFLVAFLNVENR